jgi:hypothetical protein
MTRRRRLPGVLPPGSAGRRRARVSASAPIRTGPRRDEARTLGQTTLQRCRRVLGPEHPITICVAQDANMGPLVLGDDAAADVAS